MAVVVASTGRRRRRREGTIPSDGMVGPLRPVVVIVVLKVLRQGSGQEDAVLRPTIDADHKQRSRDMGKD